MTEEIESGLSDQEVMDVLETKLTEPEELENEQPAEEGYQAAHHEESDYEPEDAEPEEAAPVLTAESQAELTGAWNQLVQAANVLHQQYNSIDWNKLRKEDPAQFATARQQFAQAGQAIAQREEQIKNAHGQMMQKHWKKEADKLLKAVPAWRDPQVADREKAEIRDYLKRKGYSTQEINQAAARDILIAREAMLKDKQVPTKKPKTIKLKGAKQGPVVKDANWYREQNAKRNPGGMDAIVTRLIRMGVA